MYAPIILVFVAILMTGCQEPEKIQKRTESKELKIKAINKCAKWKRAEIGWTEKEIKQYCTKMWRGYRE